MKRIPQEDKAGLYLTVIIHLAVLIILLLTGLGATLSRENSFVVDYSKYEDKEQLQQEIDKLAAEATFKEAISRKLQQTIGGGSTPIRNVAVDRGELKDDRGTNAKELYSDADKLEKELNQGYELPKDDDAAAATEQKEDRREQQKQGESKSSYSGPSVISYTLDGRKASKLPIPAYRCMGAGQVTVKITVNPAGTVIAAKIDDEVSSKDGCLREFAVRAARLSKFSAKSDAAPKQLGNIVYEFIAQ